MPKEGFTFPRLEDDPYQALIIAAEVFRFHPELDAEVGPWDDEILYSSRRVVVKGSDSLIALVESRIAESGMFYVLDPRPSLKVGDGTYIRYPADV